MKHQFLIGAIIGILIMIGLVLEYNLIIQSIQKYVFMSLVPLDLVFDEGINLKDYDSAQIINCLHSQTLCPEGVHYKDDVTGEIIASTIIPKKAQPYAPPSDPNAPPDPSLFEDKIPEKVQEKVTQLDTLTLEIFIGIVLIIAGIVVILLVKHRKQQSF